MLIHNKDDIEFVTEFLCLLGHPVRYNVKIQSKFPRIFKKNLMPHFLLSIGFKYILGSCKFRLVQFSRFNGFRHKHVNQQTDKQVTLDVWVYN